MTAPTLSPYIYVKDAPAALAFYARAFGATERMRLAGPDGSIMHAEIALGDGVVMISEENPAYGALSPASLGGTPFSLNISVEDVDAAHQRAIDAGATSLMAPENMFWGDRFSKIRDPFGHEWTFSHQIERLTVEEVERRAAAMFADGGCG